MFTLSITFVDSGGGSIIHNGSASDGSLLSGEITDLVTADLTNGGRVTSSMDGGH